MFDRDVFLRGIVALLLFSIFCWFLARALFNFHEVDTGWVINQLSEETSRLASTFYFNKMNTIAQLSTAILGGFWVSLLILKSEVKIDRFTTKVCFALATLSLGISLYFYCYAYDLIVTRIFYHKSFDIGADFVILFKNLQITFFLIGCLNIAATVLIGKEWS